MEVFFCVKLDYDDYQIGSPGPSFESKEAAEVYLAAHSYYDAVRSDRVWKSVEQYKQYLDGNID